jgi:hypothetical protein
MSYSRPKTPDRAVKQSADRFRLKYTDDQTSSPPRWSYRHLTPTGLEQRRYPVKPSSSSSSESEAAAPSKRCRQRVDWENTLAAKSVRSGRVRRSEHRSSARHQRIDPVLRELLYELGRTVPRVTQRLAETANTLNNKAIDGAVTINAEPHIRLLNIAKKLLDSLNELVRDCYLNQ